MKKIEQMTKLAKIVGISSDDLIDFMLWGLQENLVYRMRKHKDSLSEIRKLSDGLNRFREIVKRETGIEWDVDNLREYYDEVLLDQDSHYRKKISNDEILRLIINAEMKCMHCKKTPPEVVLHIDHVLPVSRGGSSKYENLQFLCSKCNLTKSNNKEKGILWINLKSLL